MYNNATFVTKEQLEFLEKMDKWLIHKPWKSKEELETATEVRRYITKIEKQGYYYEGEAELLNIMRSEYIKDLKE